MISTVFSISNHLTVNRRRVSRSAVATALIAILASTFAGGQSVPPNIVIVLADDMGMGDTSAFQDLAQNDDSQQVETPWLDELAAQGIRLTSAYTTSAVCSPSRYSMLTGRYPWRTIRPGDAGLQGGVVWPPQGEPLIKPGVKTIAGLLREHDYATAMIGKWHVGLRYRDARGRPLGSELKSNQHWRRADLSQPLADSPIEHGFDFFFGHSRSHHTSGAQGPDNTINQNIGPGFLKSYDGPHGFGTYSISWSGNGKALVVSGSDAYLNHRIGGRCYDEAMAWLGQHFDGQQSRQRPFFLYYGLHSNHGPYTPDDELDGVKVKGEGRFKDGRDGGDREDFVYQTDVTVGLLVDFLKNTPDPRSADGASLFENTLFIFSSDNGSELSKSGPAQRRSVGPFRGKKGTIYQGGFRVPFIATWPSGGIAPGMTSGQVFSLVDLYATFAAILGTSVDAEQAKDSVNRLDVLTNEHGVAARPPLILNSVNPKPPADAKGLADKPRPSWLAIIGESSSPELPAWKLLFDRRLMNEQGQSADWLMDPKNVPLRQLFDLRKDPAEAHDLADDPEAVEATLKLRQQAIEIITEGKTR